MYFKGHEQVLTDVFQYHKPPIRRLPDLILKVNIHKLYKNSLSILKRILHEIDEYICRPAINGHRVIRYFHRQFHKFFKQYRTKELYVLATKYFQGQLARQYPKRQIASEKPDDSLHMSELPFLLLKVLWTINYSV